MKKFLVIGMALLFVVACAGRAGMVGWFANGNVTYYEPGKEIRLQEVFHATELRDQNEMPMPKEQEWSFIITPQTKVADGVRVGQNVRVYYDKESSWIPQQMKLTAKSIIITKTAPVKGK